MISLELARRLQQRGLQWQPQWHDFFAIPDSDLDDRIFVLADMSIDVEELAGHHAIMFNGAVEWSLDYILSQDVVWLPTEEQLRELLGERLRALLRDDGGYRCRAVVGDEERSFAASTAADAYGMALLAALEASQPAPT